MVAPATNIVTPAMTKPMANLLPPGFAAVDTPPTVPAGGWL
jgi:hypothetical protein